MFNLRFKQKYKVVHVTNEIGKYVIGGMGTYINELYRYRSEDTGFIYINDDNLYPEIFIDKFPGTNDILTLSFDEYEKLEEIEFDIMVIHFFKLSFCVTEEILRTRKLAYVIHSIPLPEPPPKNDPFGGHNDVRENFKFLCDNANAIICVSYAEKERLCSLYPYFRDKIKVIHNGITLPEKIQVNENYKNSRKKFGYIGRMDYRKGILECLKVIRRLDVELGLACSNNDPFYLNTLTDYIEAADMKEKVTFYGWCAGKRKESFLNSLDALIIPSLYEPFGYVVLEAILYGLPIITSSNGGIKEIVGDYKYQFDSYDEHGMYNTLLEFQQDSVEEISKQQMILIDNLNKFTAQKMSSNYNELWDELSNIN